MNISYRFYTPTKRVDISASSLDSAKHIFQERYGYWPLGENDARSNPTEQRTVQGDTTEAQDAGGFEEAGRPDQTDDS